MEEAIAICQCREKLHQELSKNALYRFLTITKPAPVASTHQGKEIPVSGVTTPQTITQPPASNTFRTRDGQRAKKPRPRALPRRRRSQTGYNTPSGTILLIPSGKLQDPQGVPISLGRGNTHRAQDQDTARKSTFIISRQKGPNSNTTPGPPPEDGEERMLLLKPIWNALKEPTTGKRRSRKSRPTCQANKTKPRKPSFKDTLARGQTTLAAFGFTGTATLEVRDIGRSQADAKARKSDFSGSMLSMVP